MPRISPSPTLKLSHHLSPTPLLRRSSPLRSWDPHHPPRRQPFTSSSPILSGRIPTLASLFAAAMSPSSSSSPATTTSGTTTSTPTTTTYTPNPLPRSSYPEHITFSPQDFRRADSRPDPQFYTQPRFVQHIDDAAIACLKDYYAGVVIPVSTTAGPAAAASGAGAGEAAPRVLDLCSSWTSHLPDGLRGRMAACVGYGLNAKEMAANGHLTGWWVRDFNEGGEAGAGAGAEEGKGGLLREVMSGSVDVVICNVSVDYLVEPLRVLEEVRRCLKVGGTAHMAFSNRCFPTKVVGRWLKMGDEERRRWVGSYFWAVGGFEDVEEVVLKDGRDWNDPLYVVRARKSSDAV